MCTDVVRIWASVLDQKRCFSCFLLMSELGVYRGLVLCTSGPVLQYLKQVEVGVTAPHVEASVLLNSDPAGAGVRSLCGLVGPGGADV